MTASTATSEPASARYALTVNGKTYGPYAASQMLTYIHEGRVTPASIISREGGPWAPAADDASLAEAFAAKTAQAAAPMPMPTPIRPVEVAAVAQPTPAPERDRPLTARELFLKELEGVRSVKTPSFNTDHAETAGPADRRRKPRTNEVTPVEDEQKLANFLLIFDVKTRGHTKLEEEIMSLETAAKVLPGVWVVSGPYTAGSLRNRLLHHFGSLDSLFIVDASRDKLAWFNLGPEADSYIRKAWRRS